VINSLITYLKEGSIYYGIEVVEIEGQESINLLEVQKKKQELFINEELTFSNLGQVSEKIKKDSPVFLILNTSKVLTKIVPKNTSNIDNIEAAVNGAFPNLDFESFYYEVNENGGNYIASICKKEHLNGYLKALNELKLNAFSICLSVSSIDAVLDYLNENEVVVSNSILGITSKTINHIDPIPASDKAQKALYDINGVSVSSGSILGFSSILKHLLKKTSGLSNFSDEIVKGATNFQYGRYFNLILKSSLIFFAIALLVNFLFFNNYYQKVESYNETFTETKRSELQLMKLQKDVQIKQDRVEAILSVVGSRTSYYLDEIGNQLPNTLLLTSIQYQPLTKQIRANKAIEIVENNILVSGVSSNSEHFYDWVATLEKLSWTNNVETTDYDYLNATSSSFSLNIEINEQ